MPLRNNVTSLVMGEVYEGVPVTVSEEGYAHLALYLGDSIAGRIRLGMPSLGEQPPVIKQGKKHGIIKRARALRTDSQRALVHAGEEYKGGVLLFSADVSPEPRYPFPPLRSGVVFENVSVPNGQLIQGLFDRINPQRNVQVFELFPGDYILYATYPDGTVYKYRVVNGQFKGQKQLSPADILKRQRELFNQYVAKGDVPSMDWACFAAIHVAHAEGTHDLWTYMRSFMHQHTRAREQHTLHIAGSSVGSSPLDLYRELAPSRYSHGM